MLKGKKFDAFALISFLFLYLASAKIIVNTLKRMQKYKFYF